MIDDIINDLDDKNDEINELYHQWSKDKEGYSLFSDYLESKGYSIDY